MPQRTQNRPICSNCDGFAEVAIDTGTSQADGTRVTLNVTCPSCKGTGHTADDLPRGAAHRLEV